MIPSKTGSGDARGPRAFSGYDGARMFKRQEERIARFFVTIACAMGLVAVSYGLGYEMGRQECVTKGSK